MHVTSQPRWRSARTVCALVVGLPAGLAVATYACAEPTQARLTIKSNLRCEQLNGVTITVGANAPLVEERVGLGAVNTNTRPEDCENAALGSQLGTVVLAPGQATGAVAVVAGTRGVGSFPARAVQDCGLRKGTPAVNDYANCIVARRTFSYIDNRTLEFTVTLDSQCVNVSCKGNQTCTGGVCVGSELACGDKGCDVVASVDAGPPVPDAPLAIDATPPPEDAAPDPPDANEDRQCDVDCSGATKSKCAAGQVCCYYAATNTRECASSCDPGSFNPPIALCCLESCGKGEGCYHYVDEGFLSKTGCFLDGAKPKGFKLCSGLSSCPTGLVCRDYGEIPGIQLKACQLPL